MIRIIGYVK